MPNGATQAAVDEAAQTTQDAGQSTAGVQQQTETEVPGADALGEPGKKALDAMKAKWKEAERRSSERDAALAELQAKIEGNEKQYAAEQAQREAEATVLAKANDRILRSEVKAAAKGVLADPADAYKFLDLAEFEVDDDGNVDEDAIASALADLVRTKPYLAAAQGQQQRFQGSADQGARKATHKSEEQQLTEALTQAQKAHDVPRSIQIKQRLAAVRAAGSRTA